MLIPSKRVHKVVPVVLSKMAVSVSLDNGAIEAARELENHRLLMGGGEVIDLGDDLVHILSFASVPHR